MQPRRAMRFLVDDTALHSNGRSGFTRFSRQIEKSSLAAMPPAPHQYVPTLTCGDIDKTGASICAWRTCLKPFCLEPRTPIPLPRWRAAGTSMAAGLTLWQTQAVAPLQNTRISLHGHYSLQAVGGP